MFIMVIMDKSKAKYGQLEVKIPSLNYAVIAIEIVIKSNKNSITY